MVLLSILVLIKPVDKFHGNFDKEAILSLLMSGAITTFIAPRWLLEQMKYLGLFIFLLLVPLLLLIIVNDLYWRSYNPSGSP